MAKQVQESARGNSKSGPTPGKQPAPSSPVTDNAYGCNAFSGASSDNPGARTRASLTVNNDDSDAVLETIRQNGTKLDTTVTGQLRAIADKGLPPSYGMKDPNANNPKVPASIGGDNGGAPDRQP